MKRVLEMKMKRILEMKMMKRILETKKRNSILDSVPYWAVRDDGYWREAYEMAQKMAVTHRRKMVNPSVGPIQLVKLRVELSCGLDYYLTIRVQDKKGFRNDYAVKVWRKPGGAPYEVLDFDKIEGSEKKIKREKSKGQCSMTLRSSTKSEDHDEGSTELEDHDEGSTELASGVASSRLCTRGFYILLEQIRNERSKLNYAKARKVASSIWGKFSEAEKMPFMDAAAKRLKIK